jgi:hypothetical protein
MAATQPDSSRSFVKWASFGALWTILLCGVALLTIVGMFWWQAWNAPLSGTGVYQHSVDAQQRALEKTLDAYKTQADDLQRLISLLIGLSSFYALVLGVSSYFTAQHFVDRSKESSEQIDRYREQMEKTYPAFINFGSHINEAIDNLMLLLPNKFERDEFWAKLTEKDKQLILFSERSMAFVEHLNWAEKRIAILYQGLGKFYSAWYEVERGRAAQSVALMSHGGLPIPVEDLAVRAFFYLERSIERDPKNFSALNDFALACADLAELPPERSGDRQEEFAKRAQSNWTRSLALEPRQQRARYNLAALTADQGKIEEAIVMLVDALKYRNWQNEPNPLRTKDVHYNLACYRSQVGAKHESQQTEWQSLLNAAVADLEKACERYESEDRVRKQTLDTLIDDCKPGGDLEWLNSKRPEAVEAAKQKLQ